jgi:TonB family protein
VRPSLLIVILASLAMTSGCASTPRGSSTGGKEYREVRVQQPPRLRPGSPSPRYPFGQVAAGTEGRVVVRVAVTEEGKVDLNAVEVLETSGHAFTAAVRDILPHLQFDPSQMAVQECAFEKDRPVLGAQGPDCRGSPKLTGERRRTTLVLPYEFRQP